MYLFKFIMEDMNFFQAQLILTLQNESIINSLRSIRNFTRILLKTTIYYDY